MTFKEYKGLDLVAVGNEILERWREMLADFRPIRGKAEAAIQEAEALPLGGFIRV